MVLYSNKNRKLVQKVEYLEKSELSWEKIKLLKYYIIGSTVLFITCFFLYLLVERDPPKGEVVIEVNIDDQSKN